MHIAQRCVQTASAYGMEQSCRGCASLQPDAALINYYSAGETLGGHRDDVEADLSKPIVSLSIGCDAIFLLGGKLLNE